jgi:hypothetical protein
MVAVCSAESIEAVSVDIMVGDGDCDTRWFKYDRD